MDKLPEHIKIGAFVKIAEWIGRVDDIAVGQSHTLLLVDSPKQVFKSAKPEWLEFHPDAPGMIQPATEEDWLKDCEFYLQRTQTLTTRLLCMK